MTIAEQVYTLVQSLSQDQASQVLRFAESIRGELGSRSSDVDELPWAEFVLSLAGAWGDDFPSLEEIRRMWDKILNGRVCKCTFWIQIH